MISFIQASKDTRSPGLTVVVPTPLYGGSLPMAYHAADAFRDLGHNTVLVKFDPYYSLFELLGKLQVEDEAKRLRSRFAEMLAEYAVQLAVESRADLVWYTAQSPVSIRGLKKLRDHGIKSAMWFVEDVRRFDYWKYIASEFDTIFTIQTGPAAEAIRTAGCRQVVYLPCAANPKVHRPIALSPNDMTRFGSDVSFVGAGYPNRVDLFGRLQLPNLKIWGNDWPLTWKSRLQEQGRRVTAEETAMIYNATSVNLNLHSSVSISMESGDFVNPRTFEIAACGAFQLVNHQAPLADLFSADELAVVEDEEELTKKLDFFLTNDGARKKMAASAKRRVLRDHTYIHRITTALESLFETSHLFARRNKGATFGDLKTAAWGDSEMQEFLKQFADDDTAELARMVKCVSGERHALTRAELIVLLMNEFRNWGVEKGVIQ